MAPMTNGTIGPHDHVIALVTTDPVSVDEKMTLRSVAAVLTAIDIGAALVHRDHTPVGIVSERDVVRALADEADPDAVWSADVMTQDLVTADADEPILRIALRMTDEGIRHLAVRQDDHIVGVISSRDVFQVLCEDALEAW
jgi:CBS domain-containing protein